jgi:hypothetical protein
MCVNITFEQFYQLTGVEYTFVCLDINDEIVRLLNHKTVPKMQLMPLLKLHQTMCIPMRSIIWQ